MRILCLGDYLTSGYDGKEDHYPYGAWLRSDHHDITIIAKDQWTWRDVWLTIYTLDDLYIYDLVILLLGEQPQKDEVEDMIDYIDESGPEVVLLTVPTTAACDNANLLKLQRARVYVYELPNVLEQNGIYLTHDGSEALAEFLSVRLTPFFKR